MCVGTKRFWMAIMFGMVGCRRATNNGKTLARAIAKALANRNINIISGLALGIDKYENAKVFERILEKGGAIVSEYGFQTRPERQHFPARNRIISGLSDKVIIVEAKKRSGSLITANWALEQGKDVFAVPGSILAKNSVGTNNLIKEGAFLLSNLTDIFYR